MQTPIVTLTTDFGLADHYVGTMKGVILGVSRQIQVIDISHQIPKFSLLGGAYTIAQAASYFPGGTIHVVVVDPGVGTERKAILAEAGGQFYVAPDNGVLSLIFSRDEAATVRELRNESVWLPNRSSTFHGRDVFAPVAASLASGAARPEELGPFLDRQPVKLENLEPVASERNQWRGIILHIDHFGNVITNFRTGQFDGIIAGEFRLRAGMVSVTQFRPTFGTAAPGECFVYPGSSGYLELGVNQGSAANSLRVKAGDPVWLEVPN